MSDSKEISDSAADLEDNEVLLSKLSSSQILSPDAPMSWRRRFFHSRGYIRVPILPSTDSPVEGLRCRDDIWSMSRSERTRFHKYLVSRVPGVLEDLDNRLSMFHINYRTLLEENEEDRAFVSYRP